MTREPVAKVPRTAELRVRKACTTVVPTGALKDRPTAELRARRVYTTAVPTAAPMTERTMMMPTAERTAVPTAELVAERSALSPHRTQPW
jgi:hypothetical protein